MSELATVGLEYITYNECQGGKSNFTSHWIALQNPIFDYIPITACVIMF